MVKNTMSIVPVHLRPETTSQDDQMTNPVNQIACIIKKDGIEFTLYNHAEMGIVYEIMREVFGYAG